MAAVVQGASGGLGAAFCRQLLRRGGDVVALTRTPASPPLAALAAEYSGRFRCVRADFADDASVTAAAEQLPDRVATAVCCAGVMHPSGRGETAVAQLDGAAMRAVLDVNVVGPALFARAVAPRMPRADGPARAAGAPPPRLLFVSAGVGSIAGNRAGGWYSYRMSKTALNQLMRTLSVELRRKGVVTAALYPRMVDTPLSAPYQRSNPYKDADGNKLLRTPEEAVERMLKVADGLTLQNTGSFIDTETGEELPW